MRLIDADALIDRLREMPRAAYGISDIFTMVTDAPTIDAEPTVSDVIKANVEEFCAHATTNKSAPSTDLISRADAIEAMARDIPFITFTEDYRRTAERIIGTVPSALPSADAVPRDYYERVVGELNHENVELMAQADGQTNGDDLIIKGASGIKDGLYNIKDGKLFHYKAGGGTVRTYPIVTADRQGKWVYDKDGIPRCNKCNKRTTYSTDFCPNCGADMRGDKHE